MSQLIVILATLSFLILCYQGYCYATTLTGKARQDTCQQQGIFFTTLGVGAFLVHSIPVVFAGMVLIMLGLRLIAHGLDRIDKTGYTNYFPGVVPPKGQDQRRQRERPGKGH